MNMAPAAEAIWGTASTASPKGPLPNQHGCGTTGSLKKMHMQNGDSHNSGVQCAPTARRDHTSHFICLRNPSSHLLLLAAPRPLPGTVTCAQPCSHLPVGSAAPAAATSPPPPLLTAGAGTHIQHPNPQRACRAQCPGHGANSRRSSDTLQQASEQHMHAPSASAFVTFTATSTEKDQGAAVPHA